MTLTLYKSYCKTQRAVYCWMHDPAEREAIIANVAVKDKDYRVIIETACINSSIELLVVKQAYHARYKHSLEEDVASHTTGDFRKVCPEELIDCILWNVLCCDNVVLEFIL